MVSDAPVKATENLYTLAQKTTAFIVMSRAKAADGLTLAEFSELAVALLRIAVETVDVLSVPGVQKKQMVLDAVGMLFDAVADKCVPVAAWPVWLIARPTVRELVLLAASGAIESILPLVRKAAA